MYTNAHPDNRPSSFNVQQLYDQIMKRDGCVTPCHKKHLARLDDALAEMGWPEFRGRAKAILKIPCDVPKDWIQDEAELRTVGPQTATKDLLLPTAEGPRYLDRHGFIHRQPAGTHTDVDEAIDEPLTPLRLAA
jgi:hypothetical protein